MAIQQIDLERQRLVATFKAISEKSKQDLVNVFANLDAKARGDIVRAMRAIMLSKPEQRPGEPYLAFLARTAPWRFNKEAA